MKGTLSARTSALVMVMALVLMAILSACDTTPATPIPTPAPTATTVQAAAPTATQEVAVAPTAKTPSKGKISMAPAGSMKELTRSAPKGDMATRSFDVAKGDSVFESIDPARATATIPPDEPTATVGPSTPAGVPEDWTVIVDSDFSENDPGTWLTGDAGDFGASVEDGTYNMVAKNNTGFYTWSEETINWSDGYISTTVKIDGAGIAAVTARVSKTSGKFSDVICAIGNNGKYGCYLEVDGKNTTIANAASSLIKKNAVNNIALLANGADYTFFINGKSVKTFSNDSLTEGAFGLYVETGSSTTTGKFSRILFMGPGEEDINATPTEVVEEPTEVVEEPTEIVEEPTEVVVEPTTTRSSRTPTRPAPTATTGSDTGDVIVSTDFAQDSGTWYSGEGDGFSVGVTNGELVVAANNPGGIVATTSDESLDLADARIEATLRIEDSSKSKPGFVGVSARSQEFATQFEDWSQIFCGINNNTQYSCSKLSMASDGTITFTEVLKGKTSSIKANKANTIALTGKGNRWTFEVNGTKVGSFTDKSLTTGAWGVLVAAGDSPTIGHFSKLIVSAR